MEGHFWRITDVERRRVIVVLCGVNRSATGSWATVAIATDPGGFVRSAAAPTARADTDQYRVVVPGVLDASASHLSVDLGPDAAADLELAPSFGWPLRFGGGGVFSAIPFLGQYWHPHVLDGTVRGSVRTGDADWEVDGARLYAEKNWGRGFPPYWWWGQAQGFERPDVTVAFSGGRLEAGPVGAVGGGLILGLGGRGGRPTPPTARIKSTIDPGRWQMTGRGHGFQVDIAGRGESEDAHVLPVPVPAERRNVSTDYEHLRASMTVRVRERGELVFSGRSDLAGLEVGFRPDRTEGFPAAGYGTGSTGLA